MMRRFSPWAVPLGNMTMRGLSLVARFALSIYVAHMLGYDALGIFGLLVGIAGVAPSLLGFGVSYHLNRQILLRPRAEAYRLLRDRMAMSLAAATLLLLAGGAAAAFGLLPRPPYLLAGAAIVTLELIAFDLHVALINLRRPIAANFLLFVRSASWIVPVITLGLLEPGFRILGMLLGCWLGALVASFVMLPMILRDAPFAILMRGAVDWRGLCGHARRAPLIYLNDVAAAGQIYLDRFIVAHLLGLGAAGVYTLYFSITHGFYVLVASAVTQLSMPRLVAVRDEPGLAAWRIVLRREALRAMTVAVPLVLAAGATALLLLPALGFADFRRHAALFVLMLATALVRPIADLANLALYSLGEDRTLASVNLAGVALSIGAGLTCLALFGLVGIGLSALTTQVALILARGALLHRHLKRLNEAAADPR